MAAADHKLYEGAASNSGAVSAGRRRKDTRTYRNRRDYMRLYQNAWLQQRRTAWLKANGPCANCASWDRLEVDHKFRSEKVDHRVWSWSESRRSVELAKCQPLCHSCHKLKTKAEAFCHGIGGYRRGCRCPVCREAKLSQARRYRARLRIRKSQLEVVHV